jgi:hypothetical protein
MMTTLRRSLLVAALAGTVVGCSETLDAADLAALPSIDGYTGWKHYETQGFAPGHRESFRRIFVNTAVEQTPAGAAFPVGSIILKEIYELAGTPERPAPGSLRYRAIMRRPADAPHGLTLDGGWLFTSRNGDTERRVSTCWSSCHAQAPRQGVFLDPATHR